MPAPPCFPASRCGCLPGMAQHLPHISAGYSEPVGSTGNAFSCSVIPLMISSQGSSSVPPDRHRALQAWLERNYSTGLCSSSDTTIKAANQSCWPLVFVLLLLISVCATKWALTNKPELLILEVLHFFSSETFLLLMFGLSQHLSWTPKNAMLPCLWNYFFKVIMHL